jgi:hypothetical protein
MLIVILNAMDIFVERGSYAQGRWVPSGTRWCQEPPTPQSPAPQIFLSYWFTCEDGGFIPKIRQH